jgi:hypothetical protein
MRPIALAALLVLLAPAPAAATDPAAEADPGFGVALTLGVPDGVVLSGVWSPWHWLLLDAGFAYTLSPGIVTGITLQPVQWGLVPCLRGEYGHYFTTSSIASKIKQWASVPPELQPFISDASYSWWSAMVGIAFGSRQGFTFRLEGGVGWLTLYVKGASTTLPPPDNVTVSTGETKFTGFGPVARLTFAYYF